MMWKGIPFRDGRIVIILLVPFVPQIAPLLLLLKAVLKP